MLDITEFEEKYLICDSIKTVVDGNENVTVKGRGTGLDIKFDSKRTLTIFSVPEQTLAYKVRYSKVYYWPPNISPHLGDYYRIVSKSEKNLVLEHRDITAGEIIDYYYTSE